MSQPYRKIIEACIKGKARAQRELYKTFAPAMLAVCYRYARDKEEAEDFLQEGFIKVFQKIEQYDGKGSFEGWIKRIMINSAIDQLRKQKTQSVEIDESISELLQHIDPDELSMEYLFNIIQELPTGYRMVFNLYAIEGYSHKEIGQELGISESTSRSQYTRARAILAKRVQQDNHDVKHYKNVI